MNRTPQQLAALESFVAHGTRLLARASDGLTAVALGGTLALIIAQLPRVAAMLEAANG